jgi:hypothetical protein
MVVGKCATPVGTSAPPTMFDFVGGEPGTLVVGWA